jgi:hypothetical protein
MGTLLDVWKHFFAQEDWDFQAVEHHDILRVGFTGEQASWSCFAQSREAQQQLAFYSICPLRVPEAKRSLLAELLTRANYGLAMGNFELDYDDGEIRFKTSIDVEDFTELALLPPLLHHLVYSNVSTLDRYLPAILAVLAGGQSPLEAVAQIDRSQEPDLSRS